MYLRASGDNKNIGKGTIMKSNIQILDIYLHFFCDNNVVITALQTSAPENTPVQCQDLQKVHVVILKIGSSSGGTTEDTHQQLFYQKGTLFHSYTAQPLQTNTLGHHMII